MSKIQKAIDALDGCDEYSLRHHMSEVSILIEGYAEAQSELAALREELADANKLCVLLSTAETNQHFERDALQQRLTAAEQRNTDLSNALELVTDGGFDPDSGSVSWGAVRITLEDWHIIKAALKPTESGASE